MSDDEICEYCDPSRPPQNQCHGNARLLEAAVNPEIGAKDFTGMCSAAYCHCPICGIGSPRDTTQDTSVRMLVPVSYPALGKEIGELVQTKQQAYGDSFGRSGNVLRQLYPDGISPDQYDDALAVVRIVDKLFRIATNKDALGEDPWRDCAGYSLLGAARDRSRGGGK